MKAAVTGAMAGVVLAAVLTSGCGAAHRTRTAADSGPATAVTGASSSGNGAGTSGTATSGASATPRVGAARSSGTSAGAHPPSGPAGAPLNPYGPWTAGVVGVTGSRIGAVTIGMTTAQAEHASGLTPWTTSGGYFRPASPRPGFDKMFFREDGTPGLVSCIGAQQAAPISLGQRVQTAVGVGVGDPVVKLRTVYGTQLRQVRKPSSGAGASAGYLLSTSSGRISFATDDAATRVTGIGVGPSATPSTCP
jgi:hypothetical protein